MENRTRLDVLKEIQEIRSVTEGIEKQKTLYETRQSEIVTELRTKQLSTSELELRSVEDEQNNTKMQDAITNIRANNEMLDKLEQELRTMNAPVVKGEAETNTEERGGSMAVGNVSMNTNITEQRNKVKEAFGREFNNLRNQIRSGTSVIRGELAIPEMIMDEVDFTIKDVNNLVAEVDLITFGGKGKIIIEGEVSEAIWMEMTGSMEQMELDLKKVELDGYKLGGIMFVDNSTLDDNFIQLANHIIKGMTYSIQRGLNKAILIGNGSTGKSIEGIMNIPTDELAQDVAIPTWDFSAVAKASARIDNKVGTKIAVMTEIAYADNVIQGTIVENNGKVEMASLSNPYLPGGVRVVYALAGAIPDNVIIVGAFKEYAMLQRQDITIAKSEHVKFVEDMTAFRGLIRVDGKPKRTKMFARITVGTLPAQAVAPATAKDKTVI